MDAFFEERIAASHRLVVPPVAGVLQAMGDGVQLQEHHLADRIRGEEPPQRDRERLVVVVLADEDDTPRASLCLADDRVLGQRRERRLLDEHVFAGVERLQREVEVILRRYRDDHRIDRGIVDRRLVARERLRPAEPAAVLLGAYAIATGVRGHDQRSQCAKVCTVDGGDYPQPRKASRSGEEPATMNGGTLH
ncbi:MAG: hypothetical protein QM736_20300 [Vicinamibacterales bacterium]